ncbi:MAG TPA: polysaccharide biosynthesis C-terminal domain-containing protein, partial [Fibrobacteria bacterium]|nr:polysaccharide biosynthesis C-terminal domain-containing protein [Fibrobacteria bacterium]
MVDDADSKEAVDLRWGARMVLLENMVRPLEPLLVMACAGMYAGGAWGSFKLAESLAYLLFRLSLLGMDRGLIWWYGQVDVSRYRKDLSSAMGVVFTASVLGCAGMVAFSRSTLVAVRGMDLSLRDLLFVAGSIPLLAMSELVYQSNLNHKEMLGRIVGKSIVLPTVVFGGALLGHWWVPGLGLSAWFFAGNLANALVAFVVFAGIHFRNGRRLPLPGIPSADLRRFSAPLAGSDLMAGLAGRVDFMMIAALADIRAVEIYNVVMMIGKSLSSIRQSFDGILLSDFSRDGVRKLTRRLRVRMNHSVWMIGNLLGLLLIALVFWGRDLLGLVHAEYQVGYEAMLIIAFATYLNVFGDMSGLMLQGLGESRSWMFAQAIGFAVNVGCNLLWIPKWGATGGVMALGASLLVHGGICQLVLWRTSGEKPWIWDFSSSSARFFLLLVAICS